jgi:hypothetical protein
VLAVVAVLVAVMAVLAGVAADLGRRDLGRNLAFAQAVLRRAEEEP